MRDSSLLPIDLETLLAEALRRHTKAGDGDSPENLNESMRYSLLAPGKRIRPRLTLACARMLGLPSEAAIPPALALEMIHCFTLIHDDLPCMDNDDFRRGQPTNHKKFGERLALLAGDGLLALAFDVFLDATPHVPAENLAIALRRLVWASGVRGVIGGQAAEPLLDANSSLQQLRTMHAQKTGALFSASLLVPKDLAGIADDSPKGLALDVFARELGLAFQVADDLEDEPEKPDPTNVLFFLPKAEVQSMTMQRLRSASQSLTSSWGNAAHPLVQIADEVSRKIESPQ